MDSRPEIDYEHLLVGEAIPVAVPLDIAQAAVEQWLEDQENAYNRSHRGEPQADFYFDDGQYVMLQPLSPLITLEIREVDEDNSLVVCGCVLATDIGYLDTEETDRLMTRLASVASQTARVIRDDWSSYEIS